MRSTQQLYTIDGTPMRRYEILDEIESLEYCLDRSMPFNIITDGTHTKSEINALKAKLQRLYKIEKSWI